MAVTSIWSVRGWLGKVMAYVENPEKTEQEACQGLSDVIAYAINEEKTRNENAGSGRMSLDDENAGIMEQYVSGVNCSPATARMEMTAVKQRYGKNEGIMAFHGYQSFAPGECTPAMAHEIGVRLAEELWGSRFQVLVATHLDKTHHLHNHFVVNSVSFADGKRYHRSNQDYREMRSISDRLCKEYGLSVIRDSGKKAEPYAAWKAGREGKPTYFGMVKADVDEAIRKARTEKQFFHYLKEKGYSFKFGKDVTVRAEGRERGLKLARNFGEEYTMDAIRKRILEPATEGTAPCVPAVEKKVRVIHVRGDFQRAKKLGGLRGLYLHYCYLLGILPKNRPPVSAGQVHMLLREDLTRLDRIARETRLLCHYQIETAEQLISLKKNLQEKMEQLYDTRKHLRYRMRGVEDPVKHLEAKTEVSELTTQIRGLRKEVMLCDGIAARSGVIEEKVKAVRQDMRKEKESEGYEYVRRSR